jgi:signal recognition particle subunit SRP54
LLVVDGMTGQDAVNTAAAFNEKLNIDGIVLTNMDSDARAAAALTIVKNHREADFVYGTAKKLNDFEFFHPERVAGRILGLGDIVTLVEKVQTSIDLDPWLGWKKSLKKSALTLEDYLTQLNQMQKNGTAGQYYRNICREWRKPLGKCKNR